MLFCRLLIFFKINFFRKILSGISSECQTVWIKIRPNILSGLVSVQTVCKGYQQMTLGGKELKNYQFCLYPCQLFFSHVGTISCLPVLNHFQAADKVSCSRTKHSFCLFCCFTSQVNSYGHGGTVSSPSHTFSWASLNKQLTSTSCTYFRL